jgi:hypothetical protein
VAARDHSRQDFVQVHFRTAGIRVANVAPVDGQELQASSVH